MARVAGELELPDFGRESADEDQVGDKRECDADGTGSGSEGEECRGGHVAR